VTVRFQAVVLRFTPTAEQGVEDAYAFVDRHPDLWVGINMAGREDNEKGYPGRFLSVYRKMMGKYPPSAFRFTRAKAMNQIITSVTLCFLVLNALVTGSTSFPILKPWKPCARTRTWLR